MKDPVTYHPVVGPAQEDGGNTASAVLKVRSSRRAFIKGIIASGAVAGSGLFVFGCSSDRPAAGSIERLISLNINGQVRRVDVLPNETLAMTLRYKLGLTGTKLGCDRGECGTCTVLIDGEPMLSCLVLPIEVQGHEILTVEGLAKGDQPHELQVAFVEFGAAQCGYCTPGMMMSAKALLDSNPQPSTREIKECLAGNLCRCTGYLQILEAVDAAAKRLHSSRQGGNGANSETFRRGEP